MVSKSIILLDMIKSLIYKNEKLFWVIAILVSLLLIYLRYQKWKRDQLKYQRLGANIRQKLGFVESFKGYDLKKRELKEKDRFNSSISNDIIHYTYYKSNKHDSYNLLNRDLLLNKGSNDGLIEHMENQELADLFPDMDKGDFAMSENQSDKDLLVKPDFKVEAPQMSDALLKMDTRPSEQKELDDFLQNLYMYLFLCRKSLLAEISKKRDLSKSTKLSLYFSLLRDTFQNVKRTYANYTKMKLTPGYTSDPSLDKRADLILDDSESIGITSQLLDIYDNLLAKRDVEENTKSLEEMVIPPPVDGALSEEDGEEDDGEEKEKDPVIILREFADTLDDLYDTANSIISPYYSYVYELGIIPPPTDEKEGAVMIASFTSEMNSFIANYNDLMILTITHEELFAKLSVNRMRLSDLLSLPNISDTNLQNLKQLIKSKVINESMVNSFDKSIEDITIIYQYFNALYQLSQITVSAEEIDVERIEQILRGSQSYNAQGDRYTLFKKYDPPADGDNDNFTFGLKRTGRELLFVSMVDGFTTEKSLPAVPNKDSVSKAKKKKKDDAAKAFDKMGEGTTQVANEIAKGTTQVANEIAKGTVEVAKKADKELKKVGKSIKKAFKI